MKSVKLVFTLALAVCFVSMAAFSAGVDGKNTVSTQGRAGLDRSKLESDAPVRTNVSGQSRSYDKSLGSPEVRAINAAALSKYPRVSAAGLSGTYTIPGDFADLAAAAAVLNFVGLDGDVTFELTASNSSGTATFGSYPGAGTYGVTIQPAAATAVTYTFLTSSTSGKGLAFNGASNITVDGLNTGGASLTLEMSGTFPTNDAFGSTVYITNASSGISFLNTHIKGNYNTPAWEDQTEGRSCAFIWTGEFDAAPNADITFDGCTFEGGSVGIKSFSDWNSPVWVCYENLTVNNCNFGGEFGEPLIHAMWLEVGYNPVLTNNTIMGISFLEEYWNNYSTEFMEDNVFALGGEGNQNTWYYLGQTSAFHILLGHGGLVADNYIDGVTSNSSVGSGQGTAYGTRTYGYDLGYGGDFNVFMRNNRFQHIFHDSPYFNVSVIRGPGIKVYHNSVRLTGTFTTGNGTSSCLNGVTEAFNNAFNNELTGSSFANTRGVNPGGTIDYNAIYSTGRPTSSHNTVAAAVGAGVNPNGVYGMTSFTWDLHGDSTSPTAAEDIGKPFLTPVDDIDAEARDTTFGGKRDAGADEFGVTGSFLAVDAFPTSIPTPPAGGVPAGVAQTPSVVVKNNSNGSTGSFSVKLEISPDGYSQTTSVSLGTGEAKTVTFPAWTPLAAGPRTITAITLYGGDADMSNDTLSRAQAVDAPVVDTLFTFDASAEGWTGAIDWKRKNSFAKLGGVNGGSGYSWVTERPADISTYTEGAYATSQGYGSTYPGANLLTSPWLDLSTLGGTDLYISFQHSIETEPLWDRGWMQYTVDGINWIDLGVLNDPDGINWYNEDLYEHAKIDSANIDDATLVGLYGIQLPYASWTSNDNGTTGAPGDFVPNGPSGWVYVQLHVTETSHPALVGAGAARFRYVAFSDAVTSFGGWAFDNFRLNSVPPVFTGGSISGHAWTDVNGNGVDDGEADITGTKVYVSLFGSVIDSVLTSGTGDYIWSGVSLPAGYALQLDVTGVAYTVPFGITGVQNINHPSDGSTITGADFGTFVGSVSGKKYSDLNDNGANDAEPGLAGWTIEVYQDSVASGILVGSDVTDGSGNYSILLPAYAGNFVAVEVEQPTVARQTGPVGGEHVFQVTGGTPNVTGKDFGNFVYGRFRVQLNVDQNGNGVKDGGDILAVPSGSTSSFKLTKDGVGYSADSVFTLGGGIIAAQFNELDLGTYAITELDSTPGWRRTLGGVQSFVVSGSGQADTAFYLDFKYLVITGTKYNDLDGDGVKDGGEPGLAGWTINVSGGAYYGATSAVTDVNGDYSIDSVFNGSHTVSEAAQAGWSVTAPVGGTYAINGISGNLVNTTGKDFGNFANATVSGIVYRDYNGNGTKDAEDTPYSGATVDLLVKGVSDVSDGTGYLFSGVITQDSVMITAPAGFVVTQPAGGIYEISMTSGGSNTTLNFGLFQGTDSSTKYRTFTAEQLGADDQKKPGKPGKLGKVWDPIKQKPNSANLVDELLNPKTGQLPGSVQVGLDGQLNAGGKTKAFVKPNKQSSFWASLNNKSVHHTGMARGFDQDLKGKPFLKLQKSFGPNKKQNNKLFAELLTLELNLVASGTKTPAGLGALLYSDPNSSLDGMTIDQISDYADTVMTNFEFVPLGVYTELDTVVAKINAAFYHPATDDTVQGWMAAKRTWGAYKSVYEVSYLKPNPGVAPKQRIADLTDPVPTEFALEQNYPNPFNPTTTIEFGLPATSIVTLKVYNLLGQEVMTLLDHQEVEFGESVEFDASSMPSGVYLYRIVAETIADNEAGIGAETFTQVKKMVLVK